MNRTRPHGLTDADRERLAEIAERPDMRASTSEGDVPPTHGQKPDAAEPWRYVCAACESQVHKHREQNRSYQCGSCRRTWLFEDLIDKKHGKPVAEVAD